MFRKCHEYYKELYFNFREQEVTKNESIENIKERIQKFLKHIFGEQFFEGFGD
jgi:thymidylate kinase